MIIPLHAGNPNAMTGSGNWTYLVPGNVPLLIDAGIGTDAHVGALAERLPQGPANVIVTHAHDDHASGAAVLAERWPQARFWKLPWPNRDSKYRVAWHYLTDAQVVPAGDDELRVVQTPGHAPDHICLWHEPTRTLFGGDLLVSGGTVVIPPSAGGHLRDYLTSLARIDALRPRRILPAHGDVIEDPHALIRSYIDHRLARERQLLDTLASGPATVAAIVERIYTPLVPELQPMARETVLAHLLKLEEEGSVVRHDEHWRIRRHP